MGTAARFIVAIVSILSASVMMFSAGESLRPWLSYLVAIFFFSIGLASLSRGRVARAAGSIVAIGVVVAGAAHLVSTLVNGEYRSGSRSEPSVVNAVLFLIVYGVPALAYLVYGRFTFGDASIDEDDFDDQTSA